MPRPRTPLLSQDAIREAALRIIDAGGLPTLTMRKLAGELGVQAASLYGHFPTKESLLEDTADHLMRQVDVSGFAGGDWRAALAVWARSYRAALAEHPQFVPFLAYGPSLRATSLQRADAVHGGLIRAGWPPRHATMIGGAVKYLVLGAALASFANGFVDDVQVYADRYPNLVGAHRLREHAAAIDQDSFELALNSFLDGLDTRYRAGGYQAAEPRADG